MEWKYKKGSKVTMKLVEKNKMFGAVFTWNYIANNIWGKHVRKKVRLQAMSSVRSIVSNIHDRPVSSWCNTTLAPPVKAGGAKT